MTKKIHLIGLIIIPIVFLIIGSVLDLQIAQGIYFKDNYFGIIMSAFGEYPIYFAISLIGGSFFYLGLTNKNIALKICFPILGIIALGIATYFQGEHIISRNAFDIEHMWYVGYPISLILCSLGFLAGLFLTKKSDNPHLLKTLIILCVGILVPVIIVFILKDVMLRPRFRFLIGDVGGLGLNLIDDFKNWWESGKDLENSLLLQYPNIKDTLNEEFASFPSGHTNSTACIVIVLAYLNQFNSKLDKYQIPLFYIGLMWTIIMGFSRMTVGAHFLSDVAMGALISFITFVCLDLIFYKNKKKEVEVITND